MRSIFPPSRGGTGGYEPLPTADTASQMNPVDEGPDRTGVLPADAAGLTTGTSRVVVTQEQVDLSTVPCLVHRLTRLCSMLQNRRIRQKTDKVILTILVWVYFLQVNNPR